MQIGETPDEIIDRRNQVHRLMEVSMEDFSNSDHDAEPIDPILVRPRP